MYESVFLGHGPSYLAQNKQLFFFSFKVELLFIVDTSDKV